MHGPHLLLGTLAATIRAHVLGEDHAQRRDEDVALGLDGLELGDLVGVEVAHLLAGALEVEAVLDRLGVPVALALFVLGERVHRSDHQRTARKIAAGPNTLSPKMAVCVRLSRRIWA